MCVVSHGYGGLVGTRMEVVDCMQCGRKPGGVSRMSGDSRALPVCEVIH